MTDATTLEERNDAYQVLPAPAAGAKRRRYRWKTAISVMWAVGGVVLALVGVSMWVDASVFSVDLVEQVRAVLGSAMSITHATALVKLFAVGAVGGGLIQAKHEANRARRRYRYVQSDQLVAIEIGGELVTVPVEVLDDHGALVTAEDTDERE